MKKKKIHKLIITALTVMFVSNNMASIAMGITKDDSEVSYSRLIESLRIEEPYKEDSGKNFISSEVDTETEDTIAVIVEFISEPNAVAKANGSTGYGLTETKAERDHRLFEDYLAKMPLNYGSDSIEVKYSYTEVFNGVALNIKGTEVEKLIESGVVKRIHKDYDIQLDLPVEEDIDTTEKSGIQPYMTDSIPHLGIDELHSEDIKGQGIKVGVLDSGIDYNHPDLSSAYKGFKAQDGDPNSQDINTTKGWDFVDNDAEPMETTYKQWQDSGELEVIDGNYYYTSHGTHVAGTIAGRSENEDAEISVLGVAPEVELYGYRVLGPRGSGATSGIIAGIEKSVNDGMDVINMSLGNPEINHPFDPMTTAVNNATLAGVVTVIANGNAGPNSFTVGSPGTAQLPIAVGASTVDFNYDNYNLTIGDATVIGDLIGKSLTYNITDLIGQELEVVYCGIGYDKDFEDKDLEGKIALIDRGDITFAEKVENATKYGARLVIIANNVDEGTIPYIGETREANTFGISKADGEAIKNNIDEKLSLEFNGTSVIKGDEVTSFSSVGPVKQTYEIRPDIVAPGSQVYSTAPEFINDKDESVDNYGIAYQRMSGTSMAAPHIAGIAALILQENPEYTPEDVKAAMMNTSLEIYKNDGSNYSVHEIGAGRVVPIEAVHDKVAFKANYKVAAGLDKEELDNVTGMISYGKFYVPTEVTTTKTIPITVENNTDVEKSYIVEIEYSNSSRAQDAQSNNVIVDIANTVTVAAGGTNTIDATISIPVGTQFGTYEGFIHFKEVGNDSKTYQMPFSGTVAKDGISRLDYPAMNDGFAKGITAFTSSALFNRNPNTYYGLADISVALELSEPGRYIHGFVKDRETGEYVGYAGKEDASWIPEGVQVGIENFAPNGKVRKIVGDKISHEEIPLENGVYDLEVVLENYDGKTFAESIPMAIINDTNGDNIDFNIAPGIMEVTEDMYTEELWYDGAEHEGIWIKANVFNEIVDKIKNEVGLDFIKQEEVNTIFATGYYPNGDMTGMGTMSSPDGEIMIAGVERADIEEGFFRLEVSYANAGKAMNKPYVYTLVKEDNKYLSMDIEDKILSENSTLNTTISLNNGEDVVEGKFVVQNYGDATLKIKSIEESEELKALLKENNNSIEINTNTENEQDYENFEIQFKLTGDDIKGLNGDVKLFDVEYVVEGFKGVGEDLMDDSQFLYTTLRGQSSEFKNSKGEAIEIEAKTVWANFEISSKERTLIYGQTSTPMGGMTKANIYAVDPDGNRYEPTYLILDEWGGRSHLFGFNDLPVIEGDYKVILETPGAFDSVMNVPGSKINSNGESVGNTFAITSYSFYAQPMTVYSGDVNGDGAIDVVDAMEIAKVYETNIPEDDSTREAENNLVTDLTQDGIVDRRDMELLLFNYLMQDLVRVDSKVPESIVDGRDIIDVLESCGYFDEDPYTNVALNMDKENSLVGEEVNFEAVPPTEEVEFEYEFAVREKADKDWTIVQERSNSRTAQWVSTTAGQYEFKVRIFKDDIEYKCQDNKFHTVDWRPVEGIKLSENNLSLKVKEEATLDVSVLPENAEPQEFVWSTSDKSIVKVKDGVVEAKGVGEATVTVETKDGKFKDTCIVKVSSADILLKSIKLDKKSVKLNEGEFQQLKVTFKPEYATNKNVTWESSDEKVATVKDGLIVAVGAGEAVVTVTSEEGGHTATCKVTVKGTEVPTPPVEIEKITLNKDALALQIGDKSTLKVSISPENAESQKFVWKSSEEKVATVKDGVVVAVGVGEATITVETKDGKLKDTCEVTVKKAYKPSKPNLPQTGAIFGSAALMTVGAIFVGTGAIALKGKKKEKQHKEDNK